MQMRSGINQGLMALGKVIRALTNIQQNQLKDKDVSSIHIPYRESKLTRLLQVRCHHASNMRTLYKRSHFLIYRILWVVIRVRV